MRSDGTGERGFTLIEIMVALAVFSLAALALLRLESATVRGAATIDDTLVGGIVARTIAVDAVTEARPPTPGRSAGLEAADGRNWAWTRDVRATGNADIVRVDVAVANLAGQVVARTTMVRPPPAPVAPPTPSPSASPTPQSK